MTIEEITLQLEERGVVWQATTFAAIAAVSIPLLSIYSDSQYWAIEYHRVAVTQMHWAIVAPIVVAVEGVRKMFETKTTIRRRAIRKAMDESNAKGREEGIVVGREEGIVVGREEGFIKGREEGQTESAERIRAELLENGVELTPEIEKRIFGSNGHRS